MTASSESVCDCFQVGVNQALSKIVKLVNPRHGERREAKVICQDNISLEGHSHQ